MELFVKILNGWKLPWLSDVFIVNFQYIPCFFSVSLVEFEQVSVYWSKSSNNIYQNFVLNETKRKGADANYLFPCVDRGASLSTY